METANILLEEIDSDQLTFKEKQANFSVKYGDFLVNNELDITPLIDDLGMNPIKENVNELNNAEISLNTSSMHNKVSLPSEVNKKSQPILMVSPYVDNDKNISNPIDSKSYLIDPDTSQYLVDVNAGLTMIRPIPQKPVTLTKVVPLKPDSLIKKENNRVKILSEKKISTPMTLRGKLQPITPPMSLRGKLEPVTPSLVLKINPKKTKAADSSMQLKNMPVIFDDEQENVPNTRLQSALSVSQEIENDTLYLKSQNEQNINNYSDMPKTQMTPTKILNNQKNKSNVSSPNATHLKNNMPPERVAAIQEKRSFNKKLRDMIEFCLDELDDREKSVNMAKTGRQPNIDTNSQIVPNEDQSVSNTKGDENILKKRILRGKNQSNKKKDPKVIKPSQEAAERSVQKVGSCLTQEPDLPTLNENCFASLEARIKSMEETLIKRIDQNCHSIIELKKTLEPPSLNTEKQGKKVFIENEELYKKRLFKEISRFLSPDANSLIYEELFINRYAKNALMDSTVDPSPSAKRRRR